MTVAAKMVHTQSSTHFAGTQLTYSTKILPEVLRPCNPEMCFQCGFPSHEFMQGRAADCRQLQQNFLPSQISLCCLYRENSESHESWRGWGAGLVCARGSLPLG